MKTRRMMAALVVALLSVTAVMAKDIRTAVFKVSQMHCENCERKVKNNIKFEKGVKDFSTGRLFDYFLSSCFDSLTNSAS